MSRLIKFAPVATIEWTPGYAIKKLRRDRRWNQDELAEKAGVSVSTVRRVEEDRNVGTQFLRAIAEALEVDEATLYEAAKSGHKLKSVDKAEEEFMAQFSPKERATIERVLDHPSRDALFSMLQTYLEGGERKRRA
jgi:transcriptional regulator with XRE-family HTH domain